MSVLHKKSRQSLRSSTVRIGIGWDFLSKIGIHSAKVYTKKALNFEIVWPTSGTLRLLTVKGVYLVSHSLVYASFWDGVYSRVHICIKGYTFQNIQRLDGVLFINKNLKYGCLNEFELVENWSCAWMMNWVSTWFIIASIGLLKWILTKSSFFMRKDLKFHDWQNICRICPA